MTLENAMRDKFINCIFNDDIFCKVDNNEYKESVLKSLIGTLEILKKNRGKDHFLLKNAVICKKLYIIMQT